ncbi:hypothetical protein VPNG_05985 [Cytospora leucostoma]|uniref:Uncharacterized protein n=1 Tax=Cytospora leucostoma TaxID=1230097 RepID=A0A423XB14_9PEZI|nr:hypothetical protein VPNG_05985 [Cytospora leucostoma]
MVVDPILTDEEKEHFLNNGWVKIPQAFTRDQAADFTRDVWTRLGMSPTDKTTWHTPRTNMPSHRSVDAGSFAPRAWAAACELLGGEGRVHPSSRAWRDSLIVNLGSPAREGRPDPPRALWGWHVDGDFFVHYLDSPEQALLVVPLFSDIPAGGGAGGTAVYPRGMREIARHLYEHPEGVCPRMHPRHSPGFLRSAAAASASAAAAGGGGGGGASMFNAVGRGGAEGDYVELCGRAGDVYLLHPLMLHSATNNPLRNVRIITNPPVSLREPFRLDREGGRGYSLVERATLRMLGKEEDGGLKGWEITGPRERVVPERLRVQERMKQDELKRLEEQRKVAAADI